MTTMNKVEGYNKYCGPAVLSILTGKSTDECASVISSINGQYQVAGVTLQHLLMAADRLGFDQKAIFTQADGSTSLFSLITRIVTTNGMYIVMLPKHFVCIEVKDKQVYFCDNHTKEPIPAASSARLMQRVSAAYQVVERPKPVLISEHFSVIKVLVPLDKIQIRIYRHRDYDQPQYNTRLSIATFNVNSESELEEIVGKLMEKQS
jgi:hypothetical protein